MLMRDQLISGEVIKVNEMSADREEVIQVNEISADREGGYQC